jgi:hypothetical protein
MDDAALAELKQIIDKHTVRYEVWPHYEMAGGNRVIVGFDLELYGTQDHGKTLLSPGCLLCRETYDDLRRLAEWILPEEPGSSEFEIPPFDDSLHESPRGKFEVVVPIRIEHRHGFFDPVDSCEQKCLQEMQKKLAVLGISGGRGARIR